LPSFKDEIFLGIKSFEVMLYGDRVAFEPAQLLISHQK
jgi:hypothetical protein